MQPAPVSLSLDSDRIHGSYVPPPVQRQSLPPVAKSTSASDSILSSISSSQASWGTFTGACKALVSSHSSVPGPSTASSSNPSSIFPYLHRLEIGDEMTARNRKSPLLLLKLSSPSFLDAVATDVSAGKPLYSVETVSSSTTIWRSDPWDGSAKIADIRWPKELPLKGKCKDNTHGARLQMNGSAWKDTTSFLKYGSLGSSRKFYIPHHPHALKWKRAGNIYQCLTSTCKGPVATLESFGNGMEPKLRVFENLGSTDSSVPQLDHAGISLSFLDHLFVTALLLVTEPEDWMTIARNPTSLDNTSTDAVLRPKSASLRTPASARQWRKIMYGEPLYPSLKTPAVDKCTVDLNESLSHSTSVRQWRKIVYGEPLYPSLRPHSADSLDLPRRPHTSWDNASLSSESAFPATPSSAPSTGFFDTFDESDPHVTRINTDRQYVASPHSLSPTAISPIPSSDYIPFSPRTSASPRTTTRRELPHPPSAYHPPPPSMQPWLHRSRSSPRLSPGALMTDRRQWGNEDSVWSGMTALLDDTDQVHARFVTASPSASVRRRQLPTVPSQHPHPTTPLLVERRSSQRMLPPTPGSAPLPSPGVGHRQVQSYSQSTPTPPPSLRVPRPRTGTDQPIDERGEQGRASRHEKDPRELVDWMRNFSRTHHRRMLEGEEDAHSSVEEPLDEAPPPAYNAIDFSTPPQARSLEEANDCLE
ncbi:hypothetical protein V8B97DRAFT_1280870 [Scleroderma yunnanense]